MYENTRYTKWKLDCDNSFISFEYEIWDNNKFYFKMRIWHFYLFG